MSGWMRPPRVYHHVDSGFYKANLAFHPPGPAQAPTSSKSLRIEPMANDRLIIKCKACKDKRQIAVYYPIDLRWGEHLTDPKNFIEQHGESCLMDWIEDNEPGNSFDMGPNPMFEFFNENSMPRG